MATSKRNTGDELPEQPPADPVQPHVTPAPAPQPDAEQDEVGEYEIDGQTYQLSKREAESRGAKAVGKPENKSATTQNK